MKPKAAEKPKVSGYYWVKEAIRSYNPVTRRYDWDTPTALWLLAHFDAEPFYDDGSGPKEYVLEFIGSDEGGKWGADEYYSKVIVDWRGPLLAPED